MLKKDLKKIYGAVKQYSACNTIRIIKAPYIIKNLYIKIDRLGWTGHIQKMNNGKIIKIIIGKYNGGRTKVGWPNQIEDGVL